MEPANIGYPAEKKQAWIMRYTGLVFITALLINSLVAGLIQFQIYQSQLDQLQIKGKAQVARLAGDALESFLTMDRLTMSHLIELVMKQDRSIKMTTLVNADGRVLVNSRSDLEGSVYKQKDSISYWKNEWLNISRCYVNGEECLDFSWKIELDRKIKDELVLLGYAHIVYSIDSIKQMLYASLAKSGLVVIGGSLIIGLIVWLIFRTVSNYAEKVKLKLEKVGSEHMRLTEKEKKQDCAGLLSEVEKTDRHVSDLLKKTVEKTKQEQNDLTAYLIQSRYIPEGPPAIDGCDISMFFQSGSRIGGDWLDFLRLTDRHWGLVVADIAGQGINATVTMSQVRAAFHSSAQALISPLKTLVSTNRQLYRDKQENYLVTMSYVVYDEQKSTLTYCRAGHVAAILYRHDTKDVSYEKPVGIAMGIAPPDTFELILTERKIKINPGDLLLLYTDGMEKNYNSHHEFYQLERLQSIVLKYAERKTKTLVKMIENDIKQHVGQEFLHDDIAMIAFKLEEA